MLGQEQDTPECIDVGAEGTAKKLWRAADHTMGCLQDELKRAQLIAGPAVADEAALGQVGRLVAHGKRPDSNIEFFVELDVEPHPLEEICGVVAEIVEHVVRQFAKARIGRVSDRLFIRSEEHTSELQSLMRISYAVFCLKKKN